MFTGGQGEAASIAWLWRQWIAAMQS